MKVEGVSIGLVNQNSINPGSDNTSVKSPVDDSAFRSMSAQYISGMLFFQFEKLADPNTNYQYATRDSLYQAAHSNEPGGLPEYEKSIVKELLRRPALFERLDVGQDGKLDNKIDIGNIRLVMNAKEYGALDSKSDTYLSKQLLEGFGKFADLNEKQYITNVSLYRAAHGEEGVTAQDSLVAAEVLRRGLLFKRLDADGQGGLDNKIDRVNIRNVIAADDGNRLGSMSDDAITVKFITDFNQLIGPRGGVFLSYEALGEIAKPEGKTFSAEASEFARELLNRKTLLKTFEYGSSGKLTAVTAQRVFEEKHVSHFDTRPFYVRDTQRVIYDKDGSELARFDFIPDPTRFAQGSWAMHLS